MKSSYKNSNKIKAKNLKLTTLGFTLIELLAVIVVLAIIALIATPIVLNIINNTKESSNKLSGESYIKAVENAIIQKEMSDNVNVEEGTYTVQVDGNICIVSNNVCSDGTTIEIDVEGTLPDEGGTIIIDSSGTITGYTLTVNGTSITKGSNSDIDDDEDDSETYEVYENGDPVYFNVTTGVKCTESEAVSTTGTKTGCMKFYAFNDEGESSSTINLILDHNTTSEVAWNSSSSNSSGPNELLTQLKNDTENWMGVETPDNYTNEHYNYTVDYSSYGGKARLITAQEIAKITGNTTWDESDTSSVWYYLDSNTQTQTAATQGSSTYAWLFDYTYSCTSSGCNIADSNTYGYWTISADTSYAGRAWDVNFGGGVDCYGVDLGDTYGIRPVITVEKTKLS